MFRARDYQCEAVDSVRDVLKDSDSTLVVIGTGLGKTTIAAMIVRERQPCRAFFLAYYGTLVWQAKDNFESFGFDVDIEMAEYEAHHNQMFHTPDMIIGTVQSMVAGRNKKRMEHYDPKDFQLLILDEAHMFVTPSGIAAVNYFRENNPTIKVVGLTATPKRTDEKALGEMFESVATKDFDLLWGIRNGWLVRPNQLEVQIGSLDYSNVHSVAGDFNGRELADVLEAEKIVQGMASATVQLTGDGSTIIFAESIKQAELFSEVLNRHKAGSAKWISGKTPKDECITVIEDFKSGKFQYILSCGKLGVGFDAPNTRFIVDAKPTMSLLAQTQKIGRGTRAIAGTLDGCETKEQRLEAIARSEKSSVTIIGFVGNAGRHKIQTLTNVLGGKFGEDVRELALKKIREKAEPRNVSETLEEAKIELEQRKEAERLRRSAVRANATFEVVEVDPFNPFALFGVSVPKPTSYGNQKPLSEKMIAMMQKQKCYDETMHVSQQRQLFMRMIDRMNKNLSSPNQIRILKKQGIDANKMSYIEASQTIDRIAHEQGWDSKQSITTDGEERARRF